MGKFKNDYEFIANFLKEYEVGNFCEEVNE